MTGPRPLEPPGRGSWGSRLAAVALALVVVGVGVSWIAAAGGFPVVGPSPSQTPITVAGGASGESPSPPAMTPSASPAVPTATPSAGGASPSPDLDPGLDPVFGMGGHLMWGSVDTAIGQLDMLAEDGLGVVRFDVSWRGLEPARGRYAYLDKLDTIVAAAVERGIRPVISIIETPGWANGGRSPWVPPDDPADYASFAAMLAGRYAGRVDAWEIWNEPDIRLFWRPDPDAAAYARLLIAASAAIREANPDATIVGGSVTFGNTDFVRALYANGARGSFDALSVHPYTLTRAPDDEEDRFHSLTGILDDMHSVMTEEGDGATPIWVTELGWAVVGLNSVSEEQRIDYLRRSVALIRQRPWVGVVAMYTISTADSERYGLSTDGRRSAAWKAYADAVRDGDR